MIIPLIDERRWRTRLAGQPPWYPPLKPTLILAPHPDDETLAAGGLISKLRSQGTEVTVVAVTDGENAYADSPGLAQIREREQTEALGVLGVASGQIHRFRLPDSDVAAHEHHLLQAILPLVSAGTHIVAPWRNDFHPDHEACGRVAEAVAQIQGAALTSYFFWTWHRGTIEILDGLSLARLPLTEREQRAKQDALLCHRSQLEHGADPILPEELLAPARWPFEVFLPA